MWSQVEGLSFTSLRALECFCDVSVEDEDEDDDGSLLLHHDEEVISRYNVT